MATKTNKNNLSSLTDDGVVKKIIQDAIDKVITEKGKTINAKTNQKIIDGLTPILQKLDPGYLRSKSNVISGELSKEIFKKRTLLSRLRKRLAISKKSLRKIAKNLEHHQRDSDHHITRQDRKKNKLTNELTDKLKDQAKGLKKIKKKSKTPPPLPPRKNRKTKKSTGRAK